MKKVVCLLLISLLLITGCSIKKTDELTDAEQFANEYSTELDNPFVYIDLEQLEELFDNGTGILFLGNSDDEWCSESVSILANIFEENDIEQVYYFNPTPLTVSGRVLYLINEEIEDIEIKSVKIPSLYIIINGEIIEYTEKSLEDDATDVESTINSRRKELKKEYLRLIKLYMEQRDM